jgi:transposase
MAEGSNRDFKIVALTLIRAALSRRFNDSVGSEQDNETHGLHAPKTSSSCEDRGGAPRARVEANKSGKRGGLISINHNYKLYRAEPGVSETKPPWPSRSRSASVEDPIAYAAARPWRRASRALRPINPVNAGAGRGAAGAPLVFLPPYSPDLNPIEQVFAKLRILLRKAEERSVDVWRRIGNLLQHFTPQECANYLRNAGYASA